MWKVPYIANVKEGRFCSCISFVKLLIVLLLQIYDSSAFWTTFAIIHIIGCWYLSSQIYYMGRVKFGECPFNNDLFKDITQ